jgi:hypothetical protein
MLSLPNLVSGLLIVLILSVLYAAYAPVLLCCLDPLLISSPWLSKNLSTWPLNEHPLLSGVMDVITFDAPLDLGWGTCANTEDLLPTVGSGSSLLSLSFHIISASASGLCLDSSVAGVHEERVLGAQEHQAQVLR